MAGVTRQEAQQVLARHGIDLAHGNADVYALATVAASHGWQSSVEPLPRPRGTIRYHALVWAPAKIGPGMPTTISARRQAKTATEALALALATMLARQERIAPCPSVGEG